MGSEKSRQNDRYKLPRPSGVNQQKRYKFESVASDATSFFSTQVVGCISPVCVLASFAMDGKLLLIVCLALLGTVQGYTLRDILRERGQNCLITVPVINFAQTFQIIRQGHSVKILNSVF